MTVAQFLHETYPFLGISLGFLIVGLGVVIAYTWRQVSAWRARKGDE